MDGGKEGEGGQMDEQREGEEKGGEEVISFSYGHLPIYKN